MLRTVSKIPSRKLDLPGPCIFDLFLMNAFMNASYECFAPDATADAAKAVARIINVVRVVFSITWIYRRDPLRGKRAGRADEGRAFHFPGIISVAASSSGVKRRQNMTQKHIIHRIFRLAAICGGNKGPRAYAPVSFGRPPMDMALKSMVSRQQAVMVRKTPCH
jgi:hypothetical protein